MQLSKSMAAEWAAHGVRVNSLSPGYTRTEMADAPRTREAQPIWNRDTPLGRMAEVEELQGAAVFLALRRLVLRHRPRPDRGWRLHRLVTPPAFVPPAPAGRTRAWGI